MPETNKNQAMVPVNADIIINEMGTAPGLVLKQNKSIFFFLPGVPFEMKKMIETFILPKLQNDYDLSDVNTHIFRTTAIAESKLFELIKEILKKYSDVQTAFLPKYTGVDIRLKYVFSATNKKKLIFDKMLTEIRTKISKYIYTENELELEQIVGQLLREHKMIVAVAESFTGGLVSDRLTDVPGSSDYFIGSVITYSNESKISELNVNPETIKKYGAVSEQTLREMALGVQQRFKTDCAIATTGIAGPTGETPTKPVGLCFIAAVCKDKIIVKQFNFGKNRRTNKERGATAGLELLRRLLLKNE